MDSLLDQISWDVIITILPYCDPGQVAAGTYRAAKQGRTFYTPTAFFKFYRFLAKILPQSVSSSRSSPQSVR